MATDEERLLIRLEVSQRKIEKQLAAVNGTVDRKARAMERRFALSSRNMERSMQRVGVAASATFTGIARLAAAALGGLGVRELVRYADSWTRIENEIAAASQISGTLARSTSELNDIAAQSRSGIEETASLYARLLRVSGQLGVSEREVAEATDIVAKSFKAGGAAASEQAAGILQLSQALGSGVLQGDELRSLRENAPLLAQAIADEFETTIGGLKDLGSEGLLTSERVFQGILNAQQTIEAAFAVTTPTVQDAFTIMRNGAIEFVAAFDDGAGATDRLAGSLIDLGAILQSNGEAAARFGGQIRESFEIIGEAIAGVKSQFDFGDTFVSTGKQYEALMSGILDGFTVLASNAAGAGAEIARALLNMVQGVADMATGMVNTVISAIEAMINDVIAGVNFLARQMDKIPGVNMGGGLDDVSLPRFSPAPLGNRGGTPGEAYTSARDAVAATIQGARDGLTDIQSRIEDAGRRAAMGQRPVQGPNLPQGGSAPIAAELDKAATAAGKAGRAAATIRPPIDDANDAAERMGQTLASATANAITGAKNAREAFASLGDQLLSMAINSSIQNLFAALTPAIGGLFGPGMTMAPAGGGITSSTPNLLPPIAGARAMGGPVTGGRTYLVGERGPELFTPSSSGGITPNHAMGGAPAQITINNYSGQPVETQRGPNGRIDIAIGKQMAAALRGDPDVRRAMAQGYGLTGAG